MMKLSSRFLPASRFQYHRALYFTAAVAFGSTLPSSSLAFAGVHRSTKNSLVAPRTPIPPCRPPYATTRLYSNYNRDETMLDKIKDTVKTTLNPKYWFMSKEEKERALATQKNKQMMKREIDEFTKDLPFPVRMIGKLAGSMMATVAGEAMAEMRNQQDISAGLLADAQRCIVSDASAIRELGEPISVGMPFGQSSSSYTINGQSASKIECRFPIEGSYAYGEGYLLGDQNGLKTLTVNVGGRQLYINTNPASLRDPGIETGGRKTSKLGRNTNNDDVIDVEFVEKDTKDKRR